MTILIKNAVIALAIGLLSFSLATSAQESTIEGVVVSKNKEKYSITVKGKTSGRRHTYFLDDATKLTSKGQPITFADIKRGQQVSLAFRQTDYGRELVFFRVPNPDDIIAVLPIEIDEELSVSGIVTGVKPTRRTITIRGDDRADRLTLHVPAGTKITRNGKPVPILKIAKGDRAEFRYKVTEEGFIIISGRSPKAAPVAVAEQAVAEQAVAELPKTASNQYLWLFGALGLLTVAGLVNLARRRTV